MARAADGFARAGMMGGEATALGQGALYLLGLGREGEAGERIRGLKERWTAPPLRAFGAYLAGHHALLRGDYGAAGEALASALRDNGAFQDDPYLLKLRRDTERDAGIASLLSGSVPGEGAAPDPAGAPSGACRGVCEPGGGGLVPFASEAAPSPPAGSALSAGPAGPGPSAGRRELLQALELNGALAASRIAGLLPPADFRRTEAEVHNFLGLAAAREGDRDRAFSHLARAGQAARAAGFAAGEIRGLLFGAELGLKGSGTDEGRKAAERLLHRADSRGASSYRIRARVLLARYGELEGRSREAIPLLQEAVELLQARRCQALPEMIGPLFPCPGREVHERLVTLLAAEGKAGEAFTAAESARRFALVAALCGRDSLARTEAEKAFLQQEGQRSGEIRRLEQALLRLADDEAAGRAMALLGRAQEAYRMLLARMAAEAQRLHGLLSFSGGDAVSLQARLDGNTSLFSYFSTAEALYVWAVHRERVHLERIALKRAEMRELVSSFRAALQEKDRRKADQAARKAYDLLLQPVIPFVSGERIGFIADDALNYLPFAGLRYRGRYLVEGFSIFHLPEASFLKEGGAPTAGMRILAFGNPDLENEALDLARAAQEIERIRRRVGGTRVLTGPEATEAKTDALAEGYDLLHFAVRGQFFGDRIMESGLLLTPSAGEDGRLTIDEIFGLTFGGRAVVLSGCDPDPRGDPEGRGPDLMQRAFLSAGSPSVVSTLWLNDDKGVSRLLDHFYRQLARKAPLADALRTAQLQLLREGLSPGIWAAFILTGRF
jgi:CHAT domain-containing protein